MEAESGQNCRDFFTAVLRKAMEAEKDTTTVMRKTCAACVSEHKPKVAECFMAVIDD